MTLLDTGSADRILDEGTAGWSGVPEEPTAVPTRWPQRLHGLMKTVLALSAFLAALALLAGAAALLSVPHLRTAAQHDVPASWLVPTAAVIALAVLVAAWRAARRLVRNTRPAFILTVIAAIDASVGASTGMWVFFGKVLQFSVLDRVPIFSFLEIATIAFAVRARDRLLDSAARAAAGEDVRPSRGPDGVLMWLCTATSAVLSSMASISLPEAAFRLATPLIAAVLWESGLSAEYHRKFGKQMNEPGRRKKTISWRFTLERFLVEAGLADPAARDITDVAADRRLTQAAVAIVRARRAQIPGWRAWAARRARVRMRLAEEHVGIAADDASQVLLLQKIALLDKTRELLDMDVHDPWQRAASLARGDRPRDKRKPHPRPGGGGQAGRGHAQLAEELSDAIPAALGGSDEAARRVHTLLAGRDDYPALCLWLARSGRIGAKRMMAAAALYATGGLNQTARAQARDWLTRQVPGRAGQVDRAEIRLIAQALEPVWETERYPGQLGASTIPQPAEGGASS